MRGTLGPLRHVERTECEMIGCNIFIHVPVVSYWQTDMSG